jgi:hypothetical protein
LVYGVNSIITGIPDGFFYFLTWLMQDQGNNNFVGG